VGSSTNRNQTLFVPFADKSKKPFVIGEIRKVQRDDFGDTSSSPIKQLQRCTISKR
jgi:hypothetical protein